MMRCRIDHGLGTGVSELSDRKSFALTRRSRRPVAFPYTPWNCGWRRERRVRRVMLGRNLKFRRRRIRRRVKPGDPGRDHFCPLSGPQLPPLRPFPARASACPRHGPPHHRRRLYRSLDGLLGCPSSQLVGLHYFSTINAPVSRQSAHSLFLMITFDAVLQRC